MRTPALFHVMQRVYSRELDVFARVAMVTTPYDESLPRSYLIVCEAPLLGHTHTCEEHWLQKDHNEPTNP